MLTLQNCDTLPSSPTQRTHTLNLYWKKKFLIFQ